MHNKQISLNPNTSSSQHRVYSFCQVQVWILIHFSSLGCLWNPHPHAKGAYLSHTVTTIPTESAPAAIVTDLYGNGCNSACFEMLQIFNKLVWKCQTFWNWWQRLHAYLNLTLKLLSVNTFFSISVDSMKQAWSWIFSKTSELSPSCRNFIPERVLDTSGGAAYNARSTLMLNPGCHVWHIGKAVSMDLYLSCWRMAVSLKERIMKECRITAAVHLSFWRSHTTLQALQKDTNTAKLAYGHLLLQLALHADMPKRAFTPLNHQNTPPPTVNAAIKVLDQLTSQGPFNMFH